MLLRKYIDTVITQFINFYSLFAKVKQLQENIYGERRSS